MSKSRKIALIKIAAGFVAALAAAGSYLAGQLSGDVTWEGCTLLEKYLLLCDACTLPGVLMILCGALIALSNGGALNGIGYIGHYLINTLIPAHRDRIMKYADYVQEKNGKRLHGYGFLFIVGAVFMAAAVVFLLLFHQQRQLLAQ